MVKRTSFAKADCPVARAVDAIGDWWSLLIVRDALDGVRRFSDFQKSLGVSKGILTQRLRDLVALSVLTTAPVVQGGAYQEYVLTDKGRDLFTVVVGLRQWGEGHCFQQNENHSVLLESVTSQPVGRLEVRSRGGKVLRSADTIVRKVEDTPAREKRPRGQKAAPARR